MNINKFKRLLVERGFSYSRRGKGSHEILVISMAIIAVQNKGQISLDKAFVL